MSIIDDALNGFGLERKSNEPAPEQKSVEKAAELTTGGGAWFDIFGSSTNQPTFTQFNNMKQQMTAYTDWVYAAAHTIAEQAASVDIRIFMNNSKASNATLSHKFWNDPKSIYKYMHTSITKLETKNGRVVKNANIQQLEELENHPLLELLNSPNPFMTRTEFFETTFLHMELAGNAFWAVNRDKKGVPVELWPLNPQFMLVVPDKEKFIIGYIYNINNEQIPFAPDDIIHHKYSNPNDPRMGMSTVQAAARPIDTDAHAGDYNRKFFYNSAQPDAVLYTDSEVDEKMYKRLVSQWRDTFGGTANSHRTAILENGLKYMPRVLSQKDMDFLQGRNFNRDMILGIFGVPKGILGLDESMSRANLEAAQYGFMKGKIRPKMDRLTARITQDLAVQFDPKLLVSFTDPVPADKEFLLEEKKTSSGGLVPWRTPNEIRAEDGDEPIPGGDFLYIPNDLMAMAEDPFEPRPENQTAVAQEDEEKPDNDDEPIDEQDEENGGASPDDPATPPASSAGSSGSTTSASSTGDKSVAVGERGPELVLIPKKKDSLQAFKKDFREVRDNTADKFEIQFLRASRVVFQAQKTEVLENVGDRFGKAYKPSTRKMTKAQKKNLDDLFDQSGALWAAGFTDLYKESVAEMGQTALQYAVDASNAAKEPEDEPTPDQDYDTDSDGVQKFYEQRTTKVSNSIDEETDKQLKASLSEGINAGESIADLSNRVESIFGAASGYRAEAIARTESIKSTTWATVDAWRQSGVVTGYRWVSLPDACQYCAAMNGQILPITDGSSYYKVGDTLEVGGQSMTFTYDNITGPPLHVNCRCDLEPILA
jgi:HK97 family phage portal protein